MNAATRWPLEPARQMSPLNAQNLKVAAVMVAGEADQGELVE